MKNVNSVDWHQLLESNRNVQRIIKNWSTGSMTTRDVSSQLANTDFSGEFRRLVRNNGTTYGRRLARKALRYRGVSI